MRVAYLLILFLVTCEKISSQELVPPQTTTNESATSGGLISSGPESVTEVTPSDNILSRGYSFVSSAITYYGHALSSFSRRIFVDVHSLWSTAVQTVRDFLSGNISIGDIASYVRSVFSNVTAWLSARLRLLHDDLSFVLAPISSIIADGSESNEIRRAVSHASSNDTIDLLALRRYISSEIAEGRNVGAASRNLLAALTGGDAPEATVVRRAIYSTPGADSGYIGIPDFRHSIDELIANETNESARISEARVLEPFRLAVADGYSQASYFIRKAVASPLAIVQRSWHLLETRISHGRAFLMMLGPIGVATSTVLNVAWRVLSLVASPIRNVVSVVIRFGASLVGGVVRTVLRPFRAVINVALKLVTEPISLVWRAVSSLVRFVRSIIVRVVSIVLTPIRWIFDIVEDVVSGILRLVLTPIRWIFDIVEDVVSGILRLVLYPIRLVLDVVFDLTVRFPISLITRLLRFIGSIFGIH